MRNVKDGIYGGRWSATGWQTKFSFCHVGGKSKRFTRIREKHFGWFECLIRCGLQEHDEEQIEDPWPSRCYLWWDALNLRWLCKTRKQLPCLDAKRLPPT